MSYIKRRTRGHPNGSHVGSGKGKDYSKGQATPLNTLRVVLSPHRDDDVIILLPILPRALRALRGHACL